MRRFGLITITENEIKKLDMGWTYSPEAYKINLERLQVKYMEHNIKVIDFTIRREPGLHKTKKLILVIKDNYGTLKFVRFYKSKGTILVGVL